MKSACTDLKNAAIVADWGTSRLRVMLCDGDRLVDQRLGPGIGEIASASRLAVDVFTEVAGEWLPRHGGNGIILCGMVGSSLGWIEAPYADCPTSVSQLAAARTTVTTPLAEVSIIPGLACTNHIGAPDIMRGEETQILGAMELIPLLGHGRRIVCLPGTHSKWAVIENGIVEKFTTAPTGEVFGIMAEHSVLVHVRGDVPFDKAAFELGVERSVRSPASAFPFLLFESRSRTVRGDLERSAARDFLSGLLIGAEIRAARDALSIEGGEQQEVIVIGDPGLVSRYAQALAMTQVRARSIDGNAAVLAGLLALRRSMTGGNQ